MTKDPKTLEEALKENLQLSIERDGLREAVERAENYFGKYLNKGLLHTTMVEALAIQPSPSSAEYILRLAAFGAEQAEILDTDCKHIMEAAPDGCECGFCRAHRLNEALPENLKEYLGRVGGESP